MRSKPRADALILFRGVRFKPATFNSVIPSWTADIEGTEITLFKTGEYRWRHSLSSVEFRNPHDALTNLIRSCVTVSCTNCTNYTSSGACKRWETLDKEVPPEGFCYEWFLVKKKDEDT